MAVKRPGILTILALLAFVAAVLTGYKLLIYLGVVPPSWGALAFFGINSLGAVATAIKFIVLLAVNRQALFFLPAAHGSNAAVQIQRDFLPGFQAVSRRDDFELGSRGQSIIYTPFSAGFPHADFRRQTRFRSGH